MPLSEAECKELREIFNHYDTDANGVIDRNEFRELMRALDAEFTEQDIETGLQALDNNVNGVIDWDEFVAWWGSR